MQLIITKVCTSGDENVSKIVVHVLQVTGYYISLVLTQTIVLKQAQSLEVWMSNGG